MKTSADLPSPEDSRPQTFMLSFFLRGSRRAILIRAAVIICIVAVADERIEGNIPLGFLYLFPMLLVGSILTRTQIAITAAICTFLTEAFDSFDWLSPAAAPRDILIFAAFFCMGLFVYEVVRNRQLEQLHVTRIQEESNARRDAEEQLAILIESSPAAVLTADADGTILRANEAARRLFSGPDAKLEGRPIREFLPSLANVRSPDEKHSAFRTAMQCRGRRATGEIFLADVWFSTYRTNAGPRLAAMVVDASEDLRSREESTFHQLVAGSRILVGAVSHEIRNVCGAIAMAHANLAHTAALKGNKDFEALGNLIVALEKIAAMDLRYTADQAASVDLAVLLEEFRIVVEPSLAENEIALEIEIEKNLPQVWADRQSLLQVFLNLSRNSERAMLNRPERRLTIVVQRDGQKIATRFRDTGCGVAFPERLFRPFQQQAEAAGLGLYLSRAFMRSFRGDLRYQPERDGSSFIVELSPAPARAEAAFRDVNLKGDHGSATDPDSARGRSQSLPRESEPAARV